MYYIFGFAEGCNPCEQLKSTMNDLQVPFVFVNAKERGNELGQELKKQVYALPEANRVVPALFNKLDDGTYALVGTGIEKTRGHILEHYV